MKQNGHCYEKPAWTVLMCKESPIMTRGEDTSLFTNGHHLLRKILKKPLHKAPQRLQRMILQPKDTTLTSMTSQEETTGVAD